LLVSLSLPKFVRRWPQALANFGSGTLDSPPIGGRSRLDSEAMSLFGRSPLGARTLVDGDRLEVAGAAVTLRVNRRARRVSLRLDRTRREIVATAPSPRRLAE